VQSRSGNDGRTAIAVVAWIADVLKKSGQICATPDVQVLVALQDFLAAVVQRSVTKQKAQTA
jgi:hypothetical protein